MGEFDRNWHLCDDCKLKANKLILYSFHSKQKPMRYFTLILLNYVFFLSLNAQEKIEVQKTNLTKIVQQTDNFLEEMYQNQFFNGTLLVTEVWLL